MSAVPPPEPAARSFVARVRALDVYRRRRGCESSRIGQDFVVLDAEGAMLRGLNATGARVWELLDGTRSAEQVAQEIAAELRVEQRRALADVLAFVERLLERDLLERADGPTAERSGGAR